MVESSVLLEELSWYLRPPGLGILTLSAGKTKQDQKTRHYLGLPSAEPIDRPVWKSHLERIKHLSGREAVALLGVPSDAGAGIERGASHGPMALREMMGRAPVFDLGDVISVPHFIDDIMLSDSQLMQSRKALYQELNDHQRRSLPVSPLNIARRVFWILAKLNPSLRILMMGGDHTVSSAAVEALLGNQNNDDTAIIHFDAHTDLLPERMGVKYCFATWAYHANEILGRGQKLVQIGIRVSRKKKHEWEKELGVYQIWADEALALGPEGLAEKVAFHLKAKGIKKIYLTNDIDGTDARWASACGTPEPDGLTPEHILETIRRLSLSGFIVLGADLVELAPGLSLSEQKSRISTETALRYLKAQLHLLKSC